MKTKFFLNYSIVLVILVLLTTILTVLYTSKSVQENLEENAFKTLQNQRNVKVQHLENYFKVLHYTLEHITHDFKIHKDISLLLQHYNAQELDPSQNFDTNNAEIQQLTQQFDNDLELEDIPISINDFLLISDSGHIVYSYKKRADYGKSIYSKSFENSPVRSLVDKIKDEETLTFQDFSPYFANENRPSFFVGKSTFIDNKHLYFLVDINLKNIHTILSFGSDLDRKREDYLVGPDLLMRSDSLLSPQTHSVVQSFKNPHIGKVDTVAVRNGLKGQNGIAHLLDYRGIEVLSAYTPIQVGDDLQWVLISEIDTNIIAKDISKINNYIYFVISILVILVTLLFYQNWIRTTKIKRQKNRLETFIEDLGDNFIAYRHDTLGVVKYLSKNFLELTGKNPNEALGKDFHKILDWSYGLEEANELIIKLHSKEQTQGTFLMGFLNKETGKEHHFSISTHGVYNDSGDLISVEGIAQDITEEKIQANLLETSELRLNLAINSANIGIWDWDLVSNEVYLSASWKKMLGYEDHELENNLETWKENIHPDDLETAIKRVNEYLNGTYSFYKSVHRMKTKSGRYIRILDTGKIVEYDANGVPKRFIGTHIDITTQMKQSEELKLQKRAFEEIFEQSSQGLLTIEDGVYTKCNQQVLKLLHADSKEEILGKSPSDISPKYQDDGSLSRDKEIDMREKTKIYGIYTFEWLHRTFDGEIFPCEVTTVPLLMPGDKEVVHVTWRDLRVEKQKTLELLESQTYLENIMESALDGIVTINQKGIIQSFNKAAEELFGFHRSEVIGQNVKILIPEPHYSNHDQYLENYLTTGIAKAIGKTAELPAKRKDGSLFTCSLRIGEIKTNDKRIFTALVQDISKQKEIEREMLEAKNEAQKALKAKSEFLANMSHEIRTPMNAITGNTFLLKQTSLNNDQNAFVEKVENATNHLIGIINDVLDFSKIEAGKMELEETEFDFEEILNSLSDIFVFQLKGKDLELLYDIDDTMPYNLIGDPLRLTQILINLIGNAIKFTQEGSIVLQTKVIQVKNSTATISFTIRDTGIGMTQEQVKKIFSTYAQADSSTTRNYGGTGLGLAISRFLVEKMEGSLECHSEPDVGSEFTFDVKLNLQKKQNQSIQTPTENLKVLIVEDNEAAAEVFARMCRSFKFETSVTYSGHEAFDSVKKSIEQNNPYDLILLDFYMPEMNGRDTLELFYQHFSEEEIPKVIIMSAEDLQKNTELQSLKFVKFLSKPFSPSDLYDEIAALFFKDIKRTTIASKSNKNNNYKKLIPLIQGVHILLVEDNIQNQEIACAYLQKANISCVIANNGQEALEKIEQDHFDLVLMDMQMPIMDGYETTKNIRVHQNKEIQNIPIIAMTANAMQGDREKCLESGMDDYISKPIDIYKMFETISKYVKAKTTEKVLHTSDEKPVDFSQFEPLQLDTKNALAMMGDDEELYIQMLQKFAKNQNDFRDEALRLYEASKLDDLIRTAHTLKGLSANIGSSSISFKAKDLEHSLKTNGLDDEVPNKINNLAQNLEILIENIEKHFEQDAGKKEFEQINILEDEELEETLLEFQTCLQNNDATAFELFEKMRSSLSFLGFEDELEKIQNSLDSFEFEDALQTTNDLISKSNRG